MTNVEISDHKMQQSEKDENKRAQWSSKWEFLLSCVGLSVGIGNVWRFPYLAYSNGGGAFLIPYLIMLFIAGKPMYFLELSIGQFASRGPVSIWKCAPIAKGVGIAMVLCSIIVCIYYNVIMSYALYFIAMTFQKQLPWNTCDQSWANGTKCIVGFANASLNETGVKSSQLFWERKVLDLSEGLETLGGIKWDLALCLFISWLIVVLCLLKGVKSSGKVVYFAATFPYLILFALLIAGFTQKGSLDGIVYFLKPQWRKLLEIEVNKTIHNAIFKQKFFRYGKRQQGKCSIL
ncbi:sodium- and chloride-dependent glycine transporter 2-like isoform X3 [Leptotrombidium deliense]|uniref:Transporter n=1 Tax=Leptotrombidium deliense TaxID=299467 RepID=A0A443RZQ1_9ACAR|nr:sodium- and chloride-dependent glycine transporter 2-like isoform X3 [Leptotrombidium deliense]